MEPKNSCFVFWWPISLYFNTMYVCFCGALVVNKLFQFYVDVFFLSWYHRGRQRTLLLPGAWSQASKVLPSWRLCFLVFLFVCLFSQEIHSRDVRPCHPEARMYLSRPEESPMQSFLFPCLWRFGNCLRMSFHPAWLSTRKKNAERCLIQPLAFRSDVLPTPRPKELV